MDPEQLQKLVEQKFKDLNPAEDDDVKRLKQLYDDLAASLVDVPYERLQQLRTELIELSTKNEADNYVQKRKIEIDQADKDLRAFGRLQEQKAGLESDCRECQQNVIKLTQFNKEIPESEEKARQLMRTKFDEDVKQFKTKIGAEEVEANEFEAQNTIIKKKVDALLADYELNEKLFWEKIKQAEEEQQLDSAKYIEVFKKMQEDAQAAIQDKLAQDTLQKTLDDKKRKLKMLKEKQGEFLETLDKSAQTILTLKQEITKLAFNVKDSKEREQTISKRAEESLKEVLALVQKNNEVKEQMVQIDKEKENLRQQILAQQKLKQEQEKGKIKQQEAQV